MSHPNKQPAGSRPGPAKPPTPQKPRQGTNASSEGKGGHVALSKKPPAFGGNKNRIH